ncbi:MULTISPECIES: zinc-dependent metalloprotease [Actinomycetaceae]|uniref:Zinc-dependent metalloprotease n=1 Tax=Schaalia turicensis TaxID=131111 RepID=A0ABZ0RDX4_9ACTO|nr:zinc-dependent metalloprotease [Actinotignum sanguinis]MDV2436849.1 zinc-dependent metalloprotease [Actinotignum sanguinis]WPJ89192.1 zinc-dependent metalloprotease [Schaalia turicensis]
MTENSQPRDEWEKMLRAVLGDEAAEEILRSLAPGGDATSGNGTGTGTGSGAFPGLPGMGGAAGAGLPADIGLVMNQIRAVLGSSGEGPVNWKIGEQVARDTVNKSGPGLPTAAAGDQARSAMDVASLWLDPVTVFDPPRGPNQVWSRLDWIAHSLPTFRKLTAPVGANLARAFGEALSAQLERAPEEMRQMLSGGMLGGIPGGLEGMLSGMTASLLGMQYGQGLAELAHISFGTADAGFPLVEGETAALVPANISEFAAGLDVDAREVELYVAVREQAAARLFSQVPWLRSTILDAVAAYAADIAIDTDAIEEKVRELQLDPEQLMSGQMPDLDMNEVFAFTRTPTQQATLERLEHIVSLVAGWVSAVTSTAVAAQLPHSMKLSEALTRREVTEAPSNRVFGPLVGFDIAPRRLREAAAFWARAARERGMEGRDALWKHPDLLPLPEHLDDPDRFFSPAEQPSALDEELDAFLAELLSNSDGGTPFGNAPHEPGFGTTTPHQATGDSSTTDTSGPEGPEQPE